MIFQRENITTDLIREAAPLLKAHYEEVAWKQDKIPLDVDWEKYRVLDHAGSLVCYTGRVGGRLVAYSVFFLSRHPHYNSTRYAKNDIIFVHPEHRGMSGTRLIKYCEKQLIDLGVDVITYHVKTILDWGPLLERMEHDKVETCYSKWVGG